MSYNQKQLKPYLDSVADLIPLYPWNKMKKGKERGKTPIHNEWTVRPYKRSEYKEWIGKGLNLGVRIKENQLVVDIDPRNYVDDIDSPQLIAELFGYFEFEEMLWELPVVHTGSGGYHIYFNLPSGYDYKLLKGKLKEIPGVDFKKKGGYVVAAGSRHPNGEYYTWENIAEPITLSEELLKPLTRPKVEKDYAAGYGVINGTQLQELILDKLQIENYDSNDSWFPLMCAAHHATAGDGIEEFLEWSLGDSNYSADENTIRSRWESLNNDKEYQSTIGTLIYELEQHGEESQNLKAVLAFSSKPDYSELDEEEADESSILKEAKEAASEIDISSIMEVPKDKGGVEGAAIEAANNLSKISSMEDKMKCIRLIKAASLEESIEAQEILISNKVMNQGAINKRLKALESKIIDSVVEIVANKTIETVFKEGRHILTEPNKQVWAFHKTHWKPMSDEYLGKVVYGVLDVLKTKMNIEANEVSLVTMAVKGIRMRSSSLASRLFNTEKFKPIINCSNGEVHIEKDGTHSFTSHSYKSYQLRCLNVDYDPGADCPLFIETLEDIFRDFPDTEDMIRHLWEIMGYIIQPYKPEANWWMFRGPGGDGKSTILKIINSILGDALYSANEDLLNSGSGYGNQHITVDLVGKLAVVIEELKSGRALNDSGLKMLSENTKMTANPKNRDTFSFNYVGSLIMCCNFFPPIRDTSEGTVRRANVIPFNRQFVKRGEADSNRAANIIQNKKELAGVLRYMLEGYKRYIDRGHFLPPQSCKDAKLEWLCEANNVLRFVKENIKFGKPKDRVGPASAVYERYKNWCELNGIKYKGRNNFYHDLENSGLTRQNSSGNQLWIYGGELLQEIVEDFVDLESSEFEEEDF